MTNNKWGHCAHCKHFGSPAAAPLDGEEAACKESGLAKLELRVFGTCGCTRFIIASPTSTSGSVTRCGIVCSGLFEHDEIVVEHPGGQPQGHEL